MSDELSFTKQDIEIAIAEFARITAERDQLRELNRTLNRTNQALTKTVHQQSERGAWQRYYTAATTLYHQEWDKRIAAEEERDRLKAALARAEHAAMQLLTERDEAEEAADRLAYTLFTVEQIGEHSNLNNPWELAEILMLDIKAELKLAERRGIESAMEFVELAHRGICALLWKEPND